MSGHHIHLCSACLAGAPGLSDTLPPLVPQYTVREGSCMSACARPASVAFRAAGKTAYLFAGVTEDDLASLALFARLYEAAPDGEIADARPLGDLRLKLIARIPG